MNVYKRLIKKDKRIENLDRFGITRIPYGWWIRLHHRRLKNKKRSPAFQKIVKDSDFGDSAVKSLMEAVEIVRKEKKNYPVQRYKPPTNLIPGLILTKQSNHSGKTFYYRWGFCWRENNCPKNRTFSFWKSGKIYGKFLEAVAFARGKGVEINSESLDDIFYKYSVKMINDVRSKRTIKEFFDRSDIKHG